MGKYATKSVGADATLRYLLMNSKCNQVYHSAGGQCLKQARSDGGDGCLVMMVAGWRHDLAKAADDFASELLPGSVCELVCEASSGCAVLSCASRFVESVGFSAVAQLTVHQSRIVQNPAHVKGAQTRRLHYRSSHRLFVVVRQPRPASSSGGGWQC